MHPIVWTEGAFLSQQHFQYWEAWLLEQGNLWVKAMMPHAYGLVACEFDEERFKHQACVLKHLVWRHENGQWIVFDAKTMPALATPLEDKDEQLIYLIVPKNKLCSGLSGYNGAGDQAAYQADYCQIKDQYDHERVHELCLGIPRLHLSTQPLDPHAYEAWPLVKIKRLVNTQFTLDTEYFPVCMRLDASQSLNIQLRIIQEQLTNKSKALMLHLKQLNDPEIQQEYSLISEAGFELNSLITHGSASPKDLYELIAKLVMRLGVRHREYIHLEAYQHQAMGGLLKTAFHELKRLLSVEVESLPRYHLEKGSRSCPHVNNIEVEHLQGHDWYLSVDFSHLPQDALSKFNSQAKLGTMATLDYMIASALPGIVMTHLSRLPKGIRLEEGFEYFKLDTEGLDWKLVKEERSLMLYHPPFLDGKAVSLILVKD